MGWSLRRGEGKLSIFLFGSEFMSFADQMVKNGYL